MKLDYTTYVSPLAWRYGSEAMRAIWSEAHKRRLMRRVWVALATAQHQAGLVTAEQVADLQSQMENIDIGRALEIEKETRHDVMAEIRTFAEQCPVGGGVIHWGATSADITDNVDVLRLREAAVLLAQRLKPLLSHLADRIEATAHVATMGYTHIQPAEPTTVGYRLAVYAQDFLAEFNHLRSLIGSLRGKGFKGAVGTQASYQELLRDSVVTPLAMEEEAMRLLDLPYFPIASQTYTRQQDLWVLQALAGIAASLHKLALDSRILQSPAIGEWAEPFGRQQVGSSAMPFKRNPINAENICSLARYVAALPAVAWDNASQAILERSLDDSANRRLTHAEAFLVMDEIMERAARLVAGMVIDEEAIGRNMAIYGPFAATERVLMALVAAGADRQEGHEWMRQASLEAWQGLQRGEANPLLDLLLSDGRIGRYLTEGQVRHLMDARAYTGTAAERALALAQTIRQAIVNEA
jgi:adenylosuccinate lyase